MSPPFGSTGELSSRQPRRTSRRVGWLLAVSGRTIVLSGALVAGVWPLVAGFFVLSSYDAGERCAMAAHSSAGGYGGTFRYDLFPPRMLCSVAGSDGWYVVASAEVTAALTLVIVLVLAVAAMAIGVVLGVAGVPRVMPAAPSASSAPVAGAASLSVRRWARLCGMLALASLVSPMWVFNMAMSMFYMATGMYHGGSGALEPSSQIPGYVGQLVVAAAVPLLALGAGGVAWFLGRRARHGRSGAASVPLLGLLAGGSLLACTLVIGIGAVVEVMDRGRALAERPVATPIAPAPELPGPVPIESAPSTVMPAAALEEQFRAFVERTGATFGPVYTEPTVQGAVPGPALDLATAIAPYSFECGGGQGVGYEMGLSFASADTNDWDTNFDAAAAAFERVTEGWSAEGYSGATDNSEFRIHRPEPSVVAELYARHFGAVVRVSVQSLCVAK